MALEIEMALKRPLTFREWLIAEYATQDAWVEGDAQCPFCEWIGRGADFALHLENEHDASPWKCPCGLAEGLFTTLKHLCDMPDPIEHLREAIVTNALRDGA